MSSALIELGQRVTDELTGFTGIATGRSEYFYSSPRVEVQPESLDDGKPREAVWFDQARLRDCGGRAPRWLSEARPEEACQWLT